MSDKIEKYKENFYRYMSLGQTTIDSEIEFVTQKLNAAYHLMDMDNIQYYSALMDFLMYEDLLIIDDTQLN